MQTTTMPSSHVPVSDSERRRRRGRRYFWPLRSLPIADKRVDLIVARQALLKLLLQKIRLGAQHALSVIYDALDLLALLSCRDCRRSH